MDPNACIDRIADEPEAVADLAEWLGKGGFAPDCMAHLAEFGTPTPEQLARLAQLYTRWNRGESFSEFVGNAHGPTSLTPYISIRVQGGKLFLGIEPDGYVHS